MAVVPVSVCLLLLLLFPILFLLCALPFDLSLLWWEGEHIPLNLPSHARPHTHSPTTLYPPHLPVPVVVVLTDADQELPFCTFVYLLPLAQRLVFLLHYRAWLPTTTRSLPPSLLPPSHLLLSSCLSLPPLCTGLALVPCTWHCLAMPLHMGLPASSLQTFTA